MSEYKIGFWNYVDTGKLDGKQAVKDWKSLGMNLAMSFEYDAEKHDKAEMLSLLDECEKSGLKVIVCDKRTTYREYTRLGKEEFTKSAAQAVKDFGAHPATYGFHIGDEPLKNDYEDAIGAFVAVRDLAPNLNHFINFVPYYLEESFTDVMGVAKEDYGKRIDDFITRTGAKIVGYDYYGQCGYFDRVLYQGVYFKNVSLFHEVAKKHGAELFISLLSVGHWSYRVPSEDDLKWQISTSVAHGATGLMWFFVYERELDGSFRLPPIDLYGERTETFQRLSRQNRIFADYFAKELSAYDFVCAEHNNAPYGIYPVFTGTKGLKSIEYVINPEPFSVSLFENGKGEKLLAVVNLSQENPSCVKLTFDGELKKQSGQFWFGPGQMMIFTKDLRR